MAQEPAARTPLEAIGSSRSPTRNCSAFLNSLSAIGNDAWDWNLDPKTQRRSTALRLYCSAFTLVVASTGPSLAAAPPWLVPLRPVGSHGALGETSDLVIASPAGLSGIPAGQVDGRHCCIRGDRVLAARLPV
jgi:hypothetical protein